MKTTNQALLKALETASQTLPVVDAPVLPSEIAAWVENLPFSEIEAADEVCDKFAETQ